MVSRLFKSNFLVFDRNCQASKAIKFLRKNILMIFLLAVDRLFRQSKIPMQNLSASEFLMCYSEILASIAAASALVAVSLGFNVFSLLPTIIPFETVYRSAFSAYSEISEKSE